MEGRGVRENKYRETLGAYLVQKEKNGEWDMDFFRKIKSRLSFGKRQTHTDGKKDEKWNGVRSWYLKKFEADERLKELYPQYYLQLQKEVSLEEWRVLKPAIDSLMKREWRKEALLNRFEEDESLKSQYGDIYARLPDVVSDEEVCVYEDILKDYEYRREERNRWLAYLQTFPKLREKYAREYELLQKDLSEEELSAVAVLLSYESTFFESLLEQYDAYVRETTEANYAAGKVEKLYKGYIGHEELMRKYPEETEELIRYYGSEFDEFFFGKGNLRFKDMSFFREFIERNHVFWQYVITDREYTAISDKLRAYVPADAIRGIAGTYTGYLLSYENFLLVKKQYPDEITSFASQKTGDEDIMRFIHKMQPYLERREIQYMV